MTDEIRNLEQEIKRHNELYWLYNEPEITDIEYDQLTRRLKALVPDSPVLQDLGLAAAFGSRVTHSAPMLSLDKCYEDEELAHWLASFDGDLVVMPKVDGLACSLIYDDDGHFVRAATRGDGEIGEDVTANVRSMDGIPQRLSQGLSQGLSQRLSQGLSQGPVEVRGEVYLSIDRFAMIVEQRRSRGQEVPKNPRNAAAGALRQKDPRRTRAMALSFVAYDLRGPLASSLSLQSQKFKRLEALGFPVIEHYQCTKRDARQRVEAFSQKRAHLVFETDGVVLMADDLTEHERLGSTSHHPRYAIAWKFQGEEGTSVLRSVDWSVARTGTITPVACVDPVMLSGAQVTRATLHHLGFVEKLGLSIGATLAMVRRGAVIPHVERVIAAGTEPVAVPERCPSCHGPVCKDGDFLMCQNPDNCSAAQVGRLLHFVSALDIQGLGETMIERAYELGIITTLSDLFKVSTAQLATIDRCGAKNAAKISTEIEKARRPTLDVFVQALGITNVGKRASKTIAEKFGCLERLRAASVEDLMACDGIGETIARSIVDGLKRQSSLIDELDTLLEISAAEQGQAFQGIRFVFTGTLRIDRKTVEKWVKDHGGEVMSSVSKTTNYVVVGQSGRSAKSTKERAAEKLIAEGYPIKMITEDEFIAITV